MPYSAKTKMEKKVGALLAKAEHPQTGRKEADAFMAKAADLMLRYALDEAAVRADKGQEPDPIVYWQFVVPGNGKHGRARVDSLDYVASAYGCQVAFLGNDATVADRRLLIVSTQAAKDALTVLLPSLLMQMEAAATQAARAYIRQTSYPESMSQWQINKDRRRYRRSFMRAFGAAVAERIYEARGRIEEEAEGTGKALVLVSDADRINAAFEERFPKLRPQKRDRDGGNRAGRRDGEAAGKRADIGSGHLAGARQEITG